MAIKILNSLQANSVTGLWTPTLAFGGASVGITTNATYTGGTFSKVGNTCNVWGAISLTSKGSSTGIATISNFPYPPLAPPFSQYIYGGVYIENGLSLSNGLLLSMNVNTGIVTVSMNTTTGITSLTNSNFANNTGVTFSISYQVSV